MPLLVDLLLSSVLELEVDTLHSAFVDSKQKHLFNMGGADKSKKKKNPTLTLSLVLRSILASIVSIQKNGSITC